MDVSPEVASHLNRFRDGLLAVVELRGLYLYGSLTTGDFSPARSDIDVVAVIDRSLDAAVLDQLRTLHLELARGGGAYARLNCLYVPAGELGDSERLHTYWYMDSFTEWQLKVMTMAELRHSGVAVHGPWPPPGLGEVSASEVHQAVRDELASYWRPLTYRPSIWLQDRWVDFALVTLARAAAVIQDGALITKSQAIARLGDFGVPTSLAEQIRRRRRGEDVRLNLGQRLTRAVRARRIMAAGIRDLTRL